MSQIIIRLETSAMEPPSTSVICQLCNAFVSVREGNYYKFQHHIETSHDVFQDQDLIMALSFLEKQEKEVIINQVLPRMINLLDKCKSIPSEILNTELLLHEQLENPQIETCQEASSLIEQSDEYQEETQEDEEKEQITETIEITKMDIVKEDEKQNQHDSEVDSKLFKCSICHEMIKKYKFSKHRRNCQILQKHKHFNKHKK